MKSKLRFRVSVTRLFAEDRVGIAWRAWKLTPDARMDFFSEATTFATVKVKFDMKGVRLHQKMQRMRDAKAAKRLKTAM